MLVATIAGAFSPHILRTRSSTNEALIHPCTSIASSEGCAPKTPRVPYFVSSTKVSKTDSRLIVTGTPSNSTCWSEEIVSRLGSM